MTTEIYRILDANANRAREALRVLEDYARFALNNDQLCSELKNLRHSLADATKPFLADAIVHRDTPSDVGTSIKTSNELKREDLSDVVTAAGKRLGEALRVLEEFSKTFAPQSALQLEQSRYRFYSLEQSIARTLGRDTRFESVRLYVLITQDGCSIPWQEAALAAIEGGADCLQLREKTLDGGELLCRTKRFVELCRKHGAISIINDRVDVALAAKADGVHLGQGDLPAIEARKILGNGKIIGVSTHQIEQARQAVLDGADYIGVGPIFKSSTKPRDFVSGLDYARQVAQEIKIPAVAIAGITLENVDQVLEAGIKTVAVTQAVTGSQDIRAAARALKARLLQKSVGQTFLSVALGILYLAGQTFLAVQYVTGSG